MLCRVSAVARSFTIFISQKCVTAGMSGWKCFRCDLFFEKKEHARMHGEISGHAVAPHRVAA